MYSQKNKIVLIGSGYWGTNIANNLVKLGVDKFYIFDVNHKNSITLKKRFPNKIEIIRDINTCYSNSEYKYFIYATPPSINYRLIKNALKNNKYIFQFKRKIFMTKNVGLIDKTIRIAAGIGLIVATIGGALPVWGWIGIVPIATGLMNFCPLYSVIGIKTCKN